MEVNSSVDQVEDGATGAAAASTSRPSPHAIPGAKHGWLSRLRSYFIFNPLIWLYTVVMGLLSLPSSVFSNSGRIQHDFAHVWAWLIMKTIFSPVTVTGLEKIDTTRPHVYAVSHG